MFLTIYKTPFSDDVDSLRHLSKLWVVPLKQFGSLFYC